MLCQPHYFIYCYNNQQLCLPSRGRNPTGSSTTWFFALKCNRALSLHSKILRVHTLNYCEQQPECVSYSAYMHWIKPAVTAADTWCSWWKFTTAAAIGGDRQLIYGGTHMSLFYNVCSVDSKTWSVLVMDVSWKRKTSRPDRQLTALHLSAGCKMIWWHVCGLHFSTVWLYCEFFKWNVAVTLI